MDLFTQIKMAVSVKEAAEYYGLEVKRGNKVCCPFHNDRIPSMKLNEDYFYCFGCGAHGDVIDLVARLFNLSSYDAAKKLAYDFGIDPDKPPAAAALRKPKYPLAKAFQNEMLHCQRILCDYLHLLKHWKVQYAQQTLKDPYNFDFLTLREEYDEKELEDALINQITQFLLELGTGFAYLGRQVHLHVGESDFYMDLLFYHVRLHCYVVVELKTEKFKPEFAGKLNFYVTAVNKQMKSEQDNPTIGLLICKDKDDVVAEYALDDISQPIGIAAYELTKVLREELKSSLPTVEEIEYELSE